MTVRNRDRVRDPGRGIVEVAVEQAEPILPLALPHAATGLEHVARVARALGDLGGRVTERVRATRPAVRLADALVIQRVALDALGAQLARVRALAVAHGCALVVHTRAVVAALGSVGSVT